MEINTLLPKFRRRMAIFCPPNIKSNNFNYLNGQVIQKKAVSDSGSSEFRQLDVGSTVLFQIYKQLFFMVSRMSDFAKG